MKKYQSFIFDSYAFNEEKGEITLTYSLDDDITFRETIQLPKSYKLQDARSLDRALFGLHLIGGISYFKTCLPQKIEVRSGTLSEEQAVFWNTVYTKGLGEFFYTNKIDPNGVVNFEGMKNVECTMKNDGTPSGKTLIPIGGGKDSIVTMELLKKEGIDCTLFRMNEHPLITKQAEIAGLPLLTVTRTLDTQLFALNKDGALNGHIPITAYLSWLTVVTSILYGFDAIAMSNEHSANEGNTEYQGLDINHQWSKSMEFEQMFAEYVQKYVTPSVSYFSALRPLNELQIVKLFAELPQYFSSVTSCNANWKINEKTLEGNLWCGNCPKCAFVFALLSAFVAREELVKMFGKDLFADEELIPLYKELLGLEGIKPFECVGTPQETHAALQMAHEKKEWDDTPVMKMFLQNHAAQ